MSETFKENIKPFIFIIIVLILTVITAHSQSRHVGTVTEVIDGKTCVIQLQNGRLTAVLQYVETPEPQQPLYQAVRDHFQKLVLQKQVEFVPRIITPDKTVGQIMIKGVDVSQQMLRDGAAWYALPEKSGQDQAQSRLYLENETQAKNEKRGVWGVENLKPSWEYRAEQAALAKREEEEAAKNTAFIAEMQSQNQKLAKPRRAVPEVQMWADVKDQKLPSNAKTIGGLMVDNDPSNKFGIIATPNFKVNVFGNGKSPDISIGFGYFYVDGGERGRINTYVIGVDSISEKFSFLKENSLVIFTDNQKIVIGKAKRSGNEFQEGVKESLVYYIKRDVLQKIIDSKEVKFQIGAYEGNVDADIRTLLNNVLVMTSE